MLDQRAHRLVNLKDFQTAGGPLSLGRLDLTPPTDEQYILRMVIRSAGDYQIPDELDWVMPLIKLAQEHQKAINANHPYCYVTVRHGIVKSKRDDEWHVDGFSTKTPHNPEQNYIWANTDATEFADLNVTFPDDFDPRVHNINHYLEQFVEEVQKADDETVYCMDPYILHRRPSSTTGTQRTFVRISFVPIEIDDILNTPNPLLPRTYTNDGLKFRSQLITY
ncbi:MAG: hypothetical protein M0R77_19945 [Gammaproteobacteria bacterium]|nr:hypothetical protein [Gammaproteobacteria bacterium]